MTEVNWYGSRNKMASLARSLRGTSRVLLQAASSQCGRIASQAGSPKVQTTRTLRQAAGISLVKQAQRQFTVSISRTVSACAMISTASPLTSSGSLISSGGGGSDLMEGSASEDEGLVIEALNELDDL